MDTTTNEQIVLDAFAALNTGDPAGYFAAMSDDVLTTYEGSHRLGGTYHGKLDYLSRAIPPMRERLDGTVTLHITTVVAEGDTVVAQIQGKGRAKDGRSYNNRYSAWFRLDEDKIVEIHEYMDTELTRSIFG